MVNEIKTWFISHWKKLAVIGLVLAGSLVEAFYPGNPATQPVVQALKAIGLLFGVA